MVLTKAALAALYLQCAPQVAPETLHAIVGVESSANPFAVAVVGGVIKSQPETKEDAISLIKDLEKKGANYSVGLMQINKNNFAGHGLDIETAFDYCQNIKAGAKIFEDCYLKAKTNETFPDEQSALRGASSCYFSGNMTRGFKKENGGLSHVDRINNIVDKQYLVPKILPEGIENNVKVNKDYVVSQDNIQEPPITEHKQVWDVYGDFKSISIGKRNE